MEVERKRRLAAVALALTIEDEEDLSEPKRAIPQSGELLHERDEVKSCIVAPCRHRRTTKGSSSSSSTVGAKRKRLWIWIPIQTTKVSLLPDLALQLY